MAKFDSKSFNPQAFGAYVERIPKLKKNELLKSRALKPNAEIRGAFNSQTGTAYAVIPMYGLIDGEVLNYDGETDILTTSTTTYERGVTVIGRAKAWTELDFSEDITGGIDFMDNIGVQVSSYWDDIDQDTLLCILRGIYSMTGTENKKFIDNHTLDITTLAGESALVNATSLNTAIQKAAGENKSKFTIAIMHSAVATNLENLNLLSYLRQTDSNGIQRDLSLATWNGRTVLIDDSLPAKEVSADGGSYTEYTTYLLGEGAFDYEDIGAKVPSEMDRDPKTNGGMSTLYTRQRKCFAPYGISYTKKAQASLSPVNSELENGVNWELVNDGGTGAAKKYINHKAIPIARILSRG